MKTLAQESSRAELVRRLRTVRPESTRRWGRMSAHQMVCHLSDACRMAMGERPATGASGLLQRTALKWIVLYAPLRWPAGILTSPEIDQQGGGTKPVHFASDIAELESLLAAMSTRREVSEWPRHPVFDRMSRAEWLRWAYLHTDHHLRQFGA